MKIPPVLSHAKVTADQPSEPLRRLVDADVTGLVLRGKDRVQISFDITLGDEFQMLEFTDAWLTYQGWAVKAPVTRE